MSEPSTAPAADDAPLAKRVDSIEAEQQRQGGILNEIRDKLTGSPEGDTTVTRGTEPPGPSAADMAEQMRQAVRDVRAEEAAAETKEPKEPAPETTPREVMVKGKDKLQRWMFGADPK
jgi:ribonuclease D